MCWGYNGVLPKKKQELFSGSSFCSSFFDVSLGDNRSRGDSMEIRAYSGLHCEACEPVETEYEKVQHSNCTR